MGLIIQEFLSTYSSCMLTNCYMALVMVTNEKNMLGTWDLTGHFQVFTSYALRNQTKPIGDQTIRVVEVPGNNLDQASIILWNRMKEEYPDAVDSQ